MTKKYDKNYYDTHKDYFKRLQTEKIKWECGALISRGRSYRHMSTKKHSKLLETQQNKFGSDEPINCFYLHEPYNCIECDTLVTEGKIYKIYDGYPDGRNEILKNLCEKCFMINCDEYASGEYKVFQHLINRIK